jgi:2,4-dienoyl-CoA reductase-like NADH-dependent reductase (Old Yellow Enzyme family)
MSQPFKLTRVASLKTVAEFKQHCQNLGLNLPFEDQVVTGASNPMASPCQRVKINGKTLGNRLAIHPMEGWDGTTTGGTTEEMKRRWQRFGASGAKLICGGEAMAVRPDGRANSQQLIINQENRAGIKELVDILKAEHLQHWGTVDDLVIGFQLTHSGRFCRPHDKNRWEARVAFRHPLLDKKFNVTSDSQVLTDGEVEELIQAYIRAARIAYECGADFVDLKHCHGYLLHEFLGAHTRPGKFGGSFENRTRVLREIIQGIRADQNPIEFGVRLSLFDFVPFYPDPALSSPGKLGPGIPVDYSNALPYQYAFGVNAQKPLQYDLTETFQFVKLLGELGVKILNTSAGSPYYNPHIQRPAAYPPSDGYQPAHDPMIDVARQIDVVRQVRAQAPANLVIVSSGLSYVQEYLPHLAQGILRHGWSDMIGVGRAVLSYPSMLADAIERGSLETKFICRTFSECTTAPRNGLISGCYPLDKYYTSKPEFQQLKEIKKRVGA